MGFERSSNGLRTGSSNGVRTVSAAHTNGLRTGFERVSCHTPIPLEAQDRPLAAGSSALRLLAIDIGRTGALALFVGGTLAEIADMPCLADGPACRPTVNAPLLAALVHRWAPAEAVCEHVAARPGEAPSGAFAFGRSRGVVEGVLGAAAVPVRFVTPAWWKRRMGIPAGADMKDRARSVAIGRWPALAETFARVKDHDRAEAALIGLACIEERTRNGC